jgi:hypothetical protein
MDLLTAKLPEIEEFAEKQTSKLQEVIDDYSKFRSQIGLPSIQSSITSEEELEAGEQSQADEFRRIFEESQKYKKGPRTKAERTERRYELIKLALDIGMTEPEKIFEFIRDQNLVLIKCGKGFINPRIMMKKYWERQRAKGQLHQGPAQQN